MYQSFVNLSIKWVTSRGVNIGKGKERRATNLPSPEATLLLIILSMASHSPCRTQGASIALLALPWIEVRTASSGVLELTPLRTRGAWPSTAPPFTQGTATIRPAVSPSAVFGK